MIRPVLFGKCCAFGQDMRFPVSRIPSSGPGMGGSCSCMKGGALSFHGVLDIHPGEDEGNDQVDAHLVRRIMEEPIELLGYIQILLASIECMLELRKK
jgi:hypothetical protein